MRKPKSDSGTGAAARRIHPKLRMMLNGDPDVNACRADTTGALFVSARLAKQGAPISAAVCADDAPEVKLKKLDRKNARRADVMVNVFVETTEPTSLAGLRSQEGNFAVMQLPLDQVKALAQRPKVAFVEPAENLKDPGSIKIATRAKAPEPRSRIIGMEKRHRNGKGVMIGIIDVHGFDWAHPDFDDGKGGSRFVAIWDQGRRNGIAPAGFNYGVEITASAMKKARTEAAKVGVSAHDLEPQSEMVPGSHGTHVASIAAGNSGLCSKADIAAVLISVPPGLAPDLILRHHQSAGRGALPAGARRATGRSRSTSASAPTAMRTTVAVRWIAGSMPFSPDPPARFVSRPATPVRSAPHSHDDIGYILGRIHTSGKIAAKGLNHDIEWMVDGGHDHGCVRERAGDLVRAAGPHCHQRAAARRGQVDRPGQAGRVHREPASCPARRY